MLINVKMPKIVDTLTFMSRINSAEMSMIKSFISSGLCVEKKLLKRVKFQDLHSTYTHLSMKDSNLIQNFGCRAKQFCVFLTTIESRAKIWYQ